MKIYPKLLSVLFCVPWNAFLVYYFASPRATWYMLCIPYAFSSFNFPHLCPPASTSLASFSHKAVFTMLVLFPSGTFFITCQDKDKRDYNGDIFLWLMVFIAWMTRLLRDLIVDLCLEMVIVNGVLGFCSLKLLDYLWHRFILFMIVGL